MSNAYEMLKNPVALVAFLFTLILPILVGFYAMKRTKSEEDFFVGGRAMDKITVALSAVSSGRSSWLVLGLSGMAYKMGVTAVWAAVGYIVAEMFQFVYMGIRLRKFSERFNAITVPDYFEARFRDTSKILRIAASIIIIIFLTSYVGAQFNAGAKTLSTALGISIFTALMISVLMIIVYMILGGFIAVAYNDVIRAVIMIIGLVVLPVIAVAKVGGTEEVLKVLHALDPKLINPWAFGAGVVIGFLGIGFGSPGQPHIIVRYMSIDDPNKLRVSTVVGTFWNVVLAWGAIFVGLAGRAIVPDVSQLPGKNAEMIYPYLSAQYFPPILYGILIGGIFAAILSTADSQLLVVASTVVKDLYQEVIKKGTKIDEKTALTISRVTVLVVGFLAAILAYVAKDIIFWFVLFAWGGLGASFGPTLILSLYWKGTTKWGVLAGMIVGTITTIVWKLYLKPITGLYELVPAFIFSLIATIIVSMITKPPENVEELMKAME
ncbi:sodium/proline symporter [Pyrococcus abyssi]|uniref:Proline or pantothenate permease n=1 Tax=Pyrococcus abyssi (strain GE5 / Orsay) TaxID=272844 RepID=Q9V2P3_PYRAB|nr:sodium/proline symporter [Pyrococcus abyssi]CAB48955.1 Proline or pantothenate permease [Pyrococcus abyssi GE5]CCE69401.1 TPA: proline symporter (proline permease) [Pyrococcus abyssi GE5]